MLIHSNYKLYEKFNKKYEKSKLYSTIYKNLSQKISSYLSQSEKKAMLSKIDGSLYLQYQLNNPMCPLLFHQQMTIKNIGVFQKLGANGYSIKADIPEICSLYYGQDCELKPMLSLILPGNKAYKISAKINKYLDLGVKYYIKDINLYGQLYGYVEYHSKTNYISLNTNYKYTFINCFVKIKEYVIGSKLNKFFVYYDKYTFSPIIIANKLFQFSLGIIIKLKVNYINILLFLAYGHDGLVFNFEINNNKNNKLRHIWKLKNQWKKKIYQHFSKIYCYL